MRGTRLAVHSSLNLTHRRLLEALIPCLKLYRIQVPRLALIIPDFLQGFRSERFDKTLGRDMPVTLTH